MTQARAEVSERGRVEPDRVNLNRYYGVLAGTGLVILAVLPLAWVTFHTAMHTSPQPSTMPILPGEQLPEPHLQVDPNGELQRMRAQKLQRLQSYGWVDRRAGLVHIPIDRAMQLLLARGLPARPMQSETGTPGVQ